METAIGREAAEAVTPHAPPNETWLMPKALGRAFVVWTSIVWVLASLGLAFTAASRAARKAWNGRRQ